MITKPSLKYLTSLTCLELGNSSFTQYTVAIFVILVVIFVIIFVIVIVIIDSFTQYTLNIVSSFHFVQMKNATHIVISQVYFHENVAPH